MFGVVPKTMWNKLNPADENNLCTWALRCLLIEEGGKLILIDTGIEGVVTIRGQSRVAKWREHHLSGHRIEIEAGAEPFGKSRSTIGIARVCSKLGASGRDKVRERHIAG